MVNLAVAWEVGEKIFISAHDVKSKMSPNSSAAHGGPKIYYSYIT